MKSTALQLRDTYAPDIHRNPDACRACGSADMKWLEGSTITSRTDPGQLENGFKYTSVQWHYDLCECGQVNAIKTYVR